MSSADHAQCAARTRPCQGPGQRSHQRATRGLPGPRERARTGRGPNTERRCALGRKILTPVPLRVSKRARLLFALPVPRDCARWLVASTVCGWRETESGWRQSCLEERVAFVAQETQRERLRWWQRWCAASHPAVPCWYLNKFNGHRRRGRRSTKPPRHLINGQARPLAIPLGPVPSSEGAPCRGAERRCCRADEAVEDRRPEAIYTFLIGPTRLHLPGTAAGRRLRSGKVPFADFASAGFAYIVSLCLPSARHQHAQGFL